MGFVDIVFKVGLPLVWSLFGALLGWVFVVGPLVPPPTPWYAGLTHALPTTTMVAIADALKWTQASEWISSVAAPWLATQPWIFFVAGIGLFAVLWLVADDEEHMGFVPSATFWICVAFIAQTWRPAGLGDQNLAWLLLLVFALLSAIVPIVRRRRGSLDWRDSSTGDRWTETWAVGLFFPIFLARLLVSDKDL